MCIVAQAQDHYAVLQVHPSAHPDVIQAAYRRLALIYHPDKNPSAEAARMMARINVAYEVLSDPERRAEYDRERRALSDNASYTPPYETEPADYSATSESGRESRDSGRRFTTVPVGQAVRSAAAVIKLQIAFFGRPISALAAVIALLPIAVLGFTISTSVGDALWGLPFAVVTFFWWWFLGSVILLTAWRIVQRSVDAAPSRIRALQRAGGRREPFEWGVRKHLAVLSRVAGGAVLGTARFFGWPISIIALLITLWAILSNMAGAIFSDTLFPFAAIPPGGVFTVVLVRLGMLVGTLVLVWPAFILLMFLTWLFWSVIIFMIWQLLKLLIIALRRSEKSRDEER